MLYCGTADDGAVPQYTRSVPKRVVPLPAGWFRYD